MKILRISSDAYPYVVGGLPIHVYELTKKQFINGFDISLLSLGTENHKETMPFTHIILKSHNIFGNKILLSGYYKLFRSIKEADIIHIHSHLFFISGISSIFARILDKKIVLTNHGVYSASIPYKFQKYFYMPIIGKFIFRASNCILCYSEEEKKAIEKIYKHPTIIVVNNGVDLDIFKNNNNYRFNQIIWVGRHVEGKGVEFLIEAFNELLKRRPEYQLLLIGSGPNLGNVKEMIHKLNILNNVIILENVSNETVSELLNQSRLFVLPSRFEGVPRSLLEAMACGLPVVTTNIPQLIPIVDGCGYVVPFSDSTLLTASMLKIINDPELQNQLGNNSEKKINKLYNWEDLVDTVSKIFLDSLTI